MERLITIFIGTVALLVCSVALLSLAGVVPGPVPPSMVGRALLAALLLAGVALGAGFLLWGLDIWRVEVESVAQWAARAVAPICGWMALIGLIAMAAVLNWVAFVPGGFETFSGAARIHERLAFYPQLPSWMQGLIQGFGPGLAERLAIVRFALVLDAILLVIPVSIFLAGRAWRRWSRERQREVDHARQPPPIVSNRID